MNILLLGSGGREHALAWKIAQSPKLTQLFIAPGNPGTASLGKNLPIAVNDFIAIKMPHWNTKSIWWWWDPKIRWLTALRTFARDEALKICSYWSK